MSATDSDQSSTKSQCTRCAAQSSMLFESISFLFRCTGQQQLCFGSKESPHLPSFLYLAFVTPLHYMMFFTMSRVLNTAFPEIHRFPNHTLTEFRTVVNCPVSQEQFWTYPQDCCHPPPVNSLSCTIYLLSLELKGSVWLNNNLSTPPPG